MAVSAATHLPEDTALNQGERDVRNLRQERTARLARHAIVLVLVGFYCWLHLSYFSERWVAMTLEQRGVSTRAAVIDLGEDSSGPRDHAQLISYHFTVDGKQIEGSEVVWQGSYPGRTSVVVRYDQEDPTTSRLSGQRKLRTTSWAVAIFDLLLVIAALAIRREWLQSRKIQPL